MTDALKKLQRQKAEREQEAVYNRVMEQAITDYGRAVEAKRALERSIEFATDNETGRGMRDDLAKLWTAILECVPGNIRREYENRQASKTLDISGGGVM